MSTWIAFAVGQALYWLKRATFGGGKNISRVAWFRHNAVAILYRLAILSGFVGGLISHPQTVVWLLGLIGITVSIPFETLPWWVALLFGLFGEALVIDWVGQKIPLLQTQIPPLNGSATIMEKQSPFHAGKAPE